MRFLLSSLPLCSTLQPAQRRPFCFFSCPAAQPERDRDRRHDRSSVGPKDRSQSPGSITRAEATEGVGVDELCVCACLPASCIAQPGKGNRCSVRHHPWLHDSRTRQTLPRTLLVVLRASRSSFSPTLCEGLGALARWRHALSSCNIYAICGLCNTRSSAGFPWPGDLRVCRKTGLWISPPPVPTDPLLSICARATANATLRVRQEENANYMTCSAYLPSHLSMYELQHKCLFTMKVLFIRRSPPYTIMRI